VDKEAAAAVPKNHAKVAKEGGSVVVKRADYQTKVRAKKFKLCYCNSRVLTIGLLYVNACHCVGTRISPFSFFPPSLVILDFLEE
jgi:hypothetical protein